MMGEAPLGSQALWERLLASEARISPMRSSASWLTEEQPEPDAPAPAAQSRGTYYAMLSQDFEALTPNLLCRTIETVEGGGIVVLLLHTMTSLRQLYTLAMDVHARFRTEAHQVRSGLPPTVDATRATMHLCYP
jgi:hypothetical protein